MLRENQISVFEVRSHQKAIDLEYPGISHEGVTLDHHGASPSVASGLPPEIFQV